MADASAPATATIVASTASDCAEYAAASLRDAFLVALDEHDEARTVTIARHLVTCGNPLPGLICDALGVAPGSTYGAGARAFLKRAGAVR
jgi:hypothetical protein